MNLTRRDRLWRIVLSVVVNLVVPTLVFVFLPPYVGGYTIALVIGAAIPAVFTLIELIRTRRLDPIGLIAVVSFVVMLIVYVLTGENQFVLKLQEALLTGPAGLILLVSVAVGKPLGNTIFRFTSRNDTPDTTSADPVKTAALTKSLRLVTLIAGLVLVAHATAITLMALYLPTASFAQASRAVGAIILVGGAIGIIRLFRSRHAQPAMQ
ncbi:VC0807 family protein [Subtercola endophyticus]|uniref:VC0807 family protein n=1 Tax=Subtercola endophyticus TaxID=2895559 RepID=UPI001E3B9C27|nr:VC0807 family protein [Subtercola endophyticus]UFS58456.1 hypothetical protein LQ955_15835 [Subtercola endophyticus]